MGQAKKIPWYSHRLIHRKRVTSELHDSYFRLMTSKPSISKIEWTANNYITQLSSTSDGQLEIGRSYRRDVVGKATSGWRGIWALMSWGLEKMLIRCRKESHHPAEWPLDLRFSSPGKQERHNVTAISLRVKILQFLFGLQLPLTVKPHTTFSNPCNRVRGKYFVKEVFLRLYHCVCCSLRRYVSSIYIYIYISAWIYRGQYNTNAKKMTDQLLIFTQHIKQGHRF